MNRTQRNYLKPGPGKTSLNEWEGLGRLDALVNEIARALNRTSEIEEPRDDSSTTRTLKVMDPRRMVRGSTRQSPHPQKWHP